MMLLDTGAPAYHSQGALFRFEEVMRCRGGDRQLACWEQG